MQAGTVSRLRFCRRSWGLKFHFWRNLMRFGKSYICSNKLDVQEANCCFSQFNRIWNYFFGYWIEIRWFACSGVMGSDCFCFSKRDITALQLGSQIYSYASSYENSGSESSGGQGMGKIGENFGVELDESQKVRNRWSRKQGRWALQFILHH